MESIRDGFKRITKTFRYKDYNMTRVVHCKKEPYDIYIGRPSIWGNPFTIGKDGNRDEVIRKYEEYLINNDYLMNIIRELKGKVLGCWCKPHACHGDVLAKYADKVNIHSAYNKS